MENALESSKLLHVTDIFVKRCFPKKFTEMRLNSASNSKYLNHDAMFANFQYFTYFGKLVSVTCKIYAAMLTC